MTPRSPIGRHAIVTETPAGALAVELRGITKRFPGVIANHDVDITVRKGTVHAIVGENGAGKSTLMKILYGMQRPDEGTISIDGEQVVLHSPSAAIERGVGMVHQHFQLADNFTVLENIVLGNEPTSGLRLDSRTARASIRELGQRYGLEVDPDDLVEDIGVGDRQRVEILKVLYRGAQILILDEPTAVLVPQEVDELFRALAELKAQGLTVIFISHKLDEVLAVSDDITVMRAGTTVAAVAPGDVTARQLAELMVGSELPSPQTGESTVTDHVVLAVSDLSLDDADGRPLLSDVSLTIHSGEVLGIAGVEGNGQAELVECIMGMRTPTGGQVRLEDADITHWTTRQRREGGIGYIPEDRSRHGLLLEASLWENRMLGHQTQPPNSRGPLLDRRGARVDTERIVAEYDVRTPSIEVMASALSGGNQQKLIVGREMSGRPRMLIASHPTRGVDVGAQAAIWDLLRAARRDGLAVLLISADLDELIGLSDSLQVLLQGSPRRERRPGDRDAGGARLGDDRRGRGDDVKRLLLTIAAPVLALAFAIAVTSGDPDRDRARPARCVHRHVRLRPAAGEPLAHPEPRHHVLPVGARGGDRVPDEPVQHRCRRPVPARGADRGGRRRRARTCPRSCTSRSSWWSRCWSGASWAADRSSAQEPARCQRGHLDDHAELHRHRRDRLPAHPGPARRARAGQQQRRARRSIPASGQVPGLADRERQRRQGVRPDPARGRGRRRRTGSCWAGPGSASTCAPPACRSRRPSPAGSTSSDGRADHHDPLRRHRRPGRHAAAARRLVRLLARTSPPASASPGSRSRCSAATTPWGWRSAPCCGPSSTRPVRSSTSAGCPRRSSRSCRASACSRWSSPTSWCAGTRSGPQQRTVGRRPRGRTARRARAGRPPDGDRRDVAADSGRVVKPSRSSGAGCRSPAGAWRSRSCVGIGVVSFVRIVTGAQQIDSAGTHQRCHRAGHPDRHGRARRALVRARGRRQHRARGHDDPGNLGGRLGRLDLGSLDRAARGSRSWARWVACVHGGRDGDLRRRPDRVRRGHQPRRARHHPVPVRGGVRRASRRSRRRSPRWAPSPCRASAGFADSVEEHGWFFVSDVARLRPRGHVPGAVQHHHRGGAPAADLLPAVAHRLRAAAALVRRGAVRRRDPGRQRLPVQVHRRDGVGRCSPASAARCSRSSRRDLPRGPDRRPGVHRPGGDDLRQLAGRRAGRGRRRCSATRTRCSCAAATRSTRCCSSSPSSSWRSRSGRSARRRLAGGSSRSPSRAWRCSGTCPPTSCPGQVTYMTPYVTRCWCSRSRRSDCGCPSADGLPVPARGRGTVTVRRRRLGRAARGGRRRSCAGRTRPYSKFKVGVAGLVDDGRVVVGCNVENASYGVGLCAECGMVSALHAPAAAGSSPSSASTSTVQRLMPCGRCRQLLWENGGAAMLLDTVGASAPMTRGAARRVRPGRPAESGRRVSEPFAAVDVIRAKRDRHELTDAQIDWVVDAYTRGVVADEQMSRAGDGDPAQRHDAPRDRRAGPPR